MRKQIRKFISTFMATALVATSFSANAFDVKTYAEEEQKETLSQDDQGNYYYNMKAKSNLELSLEDKEEGFMFHLYDNGGKDGDYGNSDRSFLKLVAKEGYGFMVYGTVETEPNNDWLSIYDVVDSVDEESGETVKTNKVLGKDAYIGTPAVNVECLFGTTNEMLFDFKTDGSIVYSGFDITVRLFKLDKNYDININDTTGGKLSAYVNGKEVNSAKPNDKVEFKAETEEGYSLTSVEVKTSDGEVMEIEGGNWYSNNIAKLFMPGIGVEVTPSYKKEISLNGLELTVPYKGNMETEIAEGIDSFKVYDYAGKEQYGNSCDGTLVLKAQEGWRFEISGTVQTENNNDFLSIYDGIIEEGTGFIGKRGYGTRETEDLGILISTSNVITLYFHSDSSMVFDGIDLNIRVFKTDHKYALNKEEVKGGSIEIKVDGKEVSSACACSEVTVNVNPEDGYTLKELVITDYKGEKFPVWGGWYSDNVINFEMPVSDLSIKPVFVKSQEYSNFEMYIPKSGTESITVSKDIKQFKVYDASGLENTYDNNWDGYLRIEAPKGFQFEINGEVKSEANNDFLLIYEGEVSDVEAENVYIGKGKYGAPTGDVINELTSDGNVITLRFRTDGSFIYEGVDITIDVFTMLHFDANGGTGEMADYKLVGNDYVLPACDFKAPEGKVFAGWKIGNEVYKAGDAVEIGEENTITAIWKIPQILTVSKDEYDATYGDDNFKVEVTGNSTDLTFSSDNEEVVKVDKTTGEVSIVGSGNATILIVAKETDEYLPANAFVVVSVYKKKLSDSMLEALGEYEYTGSEIKPDVVVKDGDKVLVLGVDYNVLYTNNTDVGKAIVSITGAGNYDGNIISSFVIKKAANKGSDSKKSDNNKNNAKETVKVGSKVSSGKYLYKVKKVAVNGKGGEVELIGFSGKATSKVKVAASVKIGNVKYKVVYIGKKAFAKKNIKSVVIGKNVKVIGAKAFFNNKKLKKVNIKSKVLKKIGKKAFYAKRKKKLKIVVPKKKKKAYKKLLKSSKSGKYVVK